MSFPAISAIKSKSVPRHEQVLPTVLPAPTSVPLICLKTSLAPLSGRCAMLHWVVCLAPSHVGVTLPLPHCKVVTQQNAAQRLRHLTVPGFYKYVLPAAPEWQVRLVNFVNGVNHAVTSQAPCCPQGAMQGALFGARSLATGLGPVLFAAAFSVFSRSDSRLPFFPGDTAFLRLARAAPDASRQCWVVENCCIPIMSARRVPASARLPFAVHW